MDKQPSRLPGYQLPTQAHSSAGRMAQGFVTPAHDRIPQIVSIPPKRVLPIIFLPGIMGSNLRMSSARQAQLRKKNNIAWRPESLKEATALLNGNEALRQNQLDPTQTEVDEYDPATNTTGDADETSDQRHSNAKVGFRLNVGIDTPLLMDDPVSINSTGKTKEQKARARGWGEVFFDSYRQILEMCEERLNTAFRYGKLDPWWKEIVDAHPAKWQASANPPLLPLDEKTLKETVTGCWFPVHAMGYNWLQSNKDSGIRIAERIRKLIEHYQKTGYQCEKVIVVTHSMGGLVARALLHPDMGNLESRVLGIVHGVMPAIGAGAAYKRMRCGFEDPGLMSLSPIASVSAKVLGNFGREVTTVLGNAQGGLELLPSQAYGDGWLRVTHNRTTVLSLPQKGDPYEEIYKLRGKWYGLLREDWINPARQLRAGFFRTSQLLDQAKAFHSAISHTYHDQSYAHYGADLHHAAWHNVTWNIEGPILPEQAGQWQIASDNGQGKLQLVEPTASPLTGAATMQLEVSMQPARDPGDQTVPTHSAEAQLHSGKFKGIFRQTGYEHQNSYKDESALHSTLYSLVRIAHSMTWVKK